MSSANHWSCIAVGICLPTTGLETDGGLAILSLLADSTLPRRYLSIIGGARSDHAMHGRLEINPLATVGPFPFRQGKGKSQLYVSVSPEVAKEPRVSQEFVHSGSSTPGVQLPAHSPLLHPLRNEYVVDSWLLTRG